MPDTLFVSLSVVPEVLTFVTSATCLSRELA
jgi:hypothetical protein